jgi:hypothetical protein
MRFKLSDDDCLAVGFDRAAFLAMPRPYSYDNRENTFLYVMQCEGFHKVGIAANVAQRHAAIQAHNPLPVRVRHTREFSSRLYALMVEAQAHKALVAHRVHGEWFSADYAHIYRILRLIYPAMKANEQRYAAEEAERESAERERYETDPAYRAKRDAETKEIMDAYEQRRNEALGIAA